MNTVSIGKFKRRKHFFYPSFSTLTSHVLYRQAVYDMACKNRDPNSVPLDEISCSLGLKKFHNTDIYDAAEKYLFGLSPPGNVSTTHH